MPHCPPSDLVVSDCQFSSVAAGSLDGHCDPGFSRQVVPQKLLDDLGDLQAWLR